MDLNQTAEISRDAVLFFEVETRKHQQDVARLLMSFASQLLKRAAEHDASKLKEPERSIFIEYTPKLKACTYGSDEYEGFLKKMKVALDHHYLVNRHHPEFHTNLDAQLENMDLADIVEMLCDWLAATRRHADGDIEKSIDINKQRFNISHQLCRIFKNTVVKL